MGLIDEFKEFAIKGNAIDLAVGAIIGASFGKIVTSLTDDLIMPPVGFLVSKATGGISQDLTSKFVSLDGEAYKSLAAAKAAGAPVLGFGSFFNTALQFLILAFAVFVMVKAINNLRREPDPAPTAAPAPTTEEILLGEIRDLLAGGAKLPTGTAAVLDK
ncbi:MAG: large-conductance mechanosensitive channel protein MscL [Armatimonadetes bacterium]|nr:large-conductance mechanosensitive channel protein MscL [Armatimonadota bacterium]